MTSRTRRSWTGQRAAQRSSLPSPALFRKPHLSDERHREVNVGAVGHVMEAAKRHGVRRVIHCSTVGIHGPVNGLPANEESPIVPIGIYERSRPRVRRWRLNTAVTAVRRWWWCPTQVYGPGDTRLLKLFELASRRRVVLVGPGTAGYHLLYIDDLIDAFLLAAEADSASGEAFIIGAPERSNVNDIIKTLGNILDCPDQQVIRLPIGPIALLADGCERVCRPLGIPPPIYRCRIEFFTSNGAHVMGKARRMLGSRSKVPMVECLRRTVERYPENSLM